MWPDWLTIPLSPRQCLLVFSVPSPQPFIETINSIILFKMAFLVGTTRFGDDFKPARKIYKYSFVDGNAIS
jgi:hypothetical protein